MGIDQQEGDSGNSGFRWKRELPFDSVAYNSEDGLQNCDFNQRSIKTLHNGIIAIGGLYGVNVFAPDHIRYNKMLPNVMFTGLSLFDEAVKVGQSYGGRVLIKKS